MRIGGVGSFPNLMAPTQAANNPAQAGNNLTQSVGNAPDAQGSASGSGFGDAIKNAVSEVNNLQGNADDLSQKLATGDVQDVHQVMLALNKASNAFGLTVQVRNKALDAYQEIMRMQV